MKLLILTQYLENYKELAKLTDASKQKYAEKWDHDFVAYIGNYCEWGFDFQRIKLLYDVLFKSSLGKDYDAIWWMGSDVMIMNQTIDIKKFIVPNKSFFIHRDINGLNNDSFIILKTEWSKKWLEFIIGKEPEYRHDCWESQRVMQHYLETDAWKNEAEIVAHPGFNSYFYDKYNWPETTPGHFNYGDFVLHLPGMDLQQRLDLFKSERVKKLIIE